jgi:glycosyltransferase involved in cell wall biosynthesis
VNKYIPFVYNPVIRDYKRKLTYYLKSNHQDVVISLGGMETYFLTTVNDGSKKILWFHFAFDISRTFSDELYKGWKSKLVYWIQTTRRVYHARKFDKMIVLSQADLATWNKYVNNAIYIYNPVTIEKPLLAELSNHRAIAVGVLGVQKGFDYLIDAWKLVNEKHPSWTLDIFGEGPDRSKLQAQIDNNGLRNVVILRGRTNSIVSEYANHSFFILSSRAEGFGLVLVEASICGLPLVSFACKQGPSEIIQDGVNGFLVNEVGDIKTLADKINILIEDENLRKIMGRNALLKSQKFSYEVIRPQWLKVLNNIIDD